MVAMPPEPDFDALVLEHQRLAQRYARERLADADPDLFAGVRPATVVRRITLPLGRWRVTVRSSAPLSRPIALGTSRAIAGSWRVPRAPGTESCGLTGQPPNPGRDGRRETGDPAVDMPGFEHAVRRRRAASPLAVGRDQGRGPDVAR